MANISRRQLMRTGLAAGAAVAAARCGAPQGTPNNPAPGPEVNTNQIKDVTLRLIGTGVFSNQRDPRQSPRRPRVQH
jgi:putative spermidine/putrescine transport system substrate-binding protein